MSQTTEHFKPSLGLTDATMLVAGSMIGSGIFIVSADMLKDVGSAGWLIFAWLLTGFMTITAALSYGELSAMFPKAGGQYVYLKEAYNPLVGFLYGWSFFAVIQTGTIAAVGVAFSKFAAYLIPAVSEKNILADFGFFKISAAQVVSILLIIFLTFINTRGVKSGKLIQNVFTGAKLIALFSLIIFGFLLAFNKDIWAANWQHPFAMMHYNKDSNGWTEITGVAVLGAMASALVGSIFSSDAWNGITFIAGEVKNPQRNIGLSLFLGTLIVTVIYVCCNLMYLSVLPIGTTPADVQSIAFAPENRVATAAAHSILGNAGTYIIAVLIMVSTFGCNNGLILSGARVYYTMAKDGLFFKQTGTLNKASVPAYGLWIQCAVAALLCLSGRYGDLLDYVSFVVMLFYILTIAGIFILRRQRPLAPRPYKAFGYPVLPFIYIVLAAVFCISLIIYKPTYTWPGLIIVLIGVPLYYIAVSAKKKAL